VTLLLDCGADVHTQGRDKQTALHVASQQKNHENILRLLLDRGANVNAQNALGYTPLHYAVAFKLESNVQLLLERGAKIEGTDKDGSTALHLVADASVPRVFQTNINLIRILLNHGADLEAKDKIGRTLLHLLVDNGDEEEVKYVLGCGAFVDVRDENGENPLHYAAAAIERNESHRNIMCLLLQHGLDINSKRLDGDTALHIATFWAPLYNVDKVNLLLTWGADTKATNNKNKTPLEQALEGGSWGADVARILKQAEERK
jgi:ankyrin repeat protein